ncbi:MAG: nicotinamide riboside transporter PnuC [Clostridia bacterium]|nr:nicotinamide riboside transporter PnuC [Clostridia bacterium]
MAILLTVSGLIFHQSFFRILPLFISLAVMILQAKVSRYAFLVGGLNSILYAVVYFYYGLYGVAAQAFLFSFPMQIITFFNWKKNAEKDTVRFRRMKGWQYAVCIVSYIVAWVGLYFILKHIGSDYAVLDNTVTLLGIFASVLTVFAYIEYAWLLLSVSIMNIFLYIQVIPVHHDQVTYLVYGIYSLVCISMHFRKARRLYKEQQNK